VDAAVGDIAVAVQIGGAQNFRAAYCFEEGNIENAEIFFRILFVVVRYLWAG
jgi:hypothetical protein